MEGDDTLYAVEINRDLAKMFQSSAYSRDARIRALEACASQADAAVRRRETRVRPRDADIHGRESRATRIEA
jgi:hypothetical protein